MSEILLNLDNFSHNITQIARKIGGTDKIIAVLKDNAYGHGAKIMAKSAANLGIKFACVRNQSEAKEIEKYFKNILILSHIPNGKEKSKFIYAINEIAALNLIKPNSKIHLAIDTLMHRNGINSSEFQKACEIAKSRNLKLMGAFTHFRCADEIGSDYFAQNELFKKAKFSLKIIAAQFGYENLIFHSHNSAALTRCDKIDDDFVRIGMAMYGYNEFNENLNLKPVLSLWANKISQRVLKKGECVGYGAKFCAKKDMEIATYDLGYADGLFRYNGEGNLALADGKFILGTMSMDSFSCENLTDEICVFNDARIWADFFDTINYEILVKLSPKIKRKTIKSE